MKGPIHVGVSPLSNRIYAGYVCKDQRTWRDGKEDVTGEACAAVAQHAIAKGEAIVVTCNGKPAYEITARALPEKDTAPIKKGGPVDYPNKWRR